MLQHNYALYDKLIQEAINGSDVDSEAAGGTVVDDVDEQYNPSIDLELMAVDEKVEGDEDSVPRIR